MVFNRKNFGRSLVATGAVVHRIGKSLKRKFSGVQGGYTKKRAVKVGSRSAYSYSKSRTQSKKNSQSSNVYDHNTSVLKKKMFIIRRNKEPYKSAGRWSYRNMFSGYIECLAGRQAAGQICSVGTSLQTVSAIAGVGISTNQTNNLFADSLFSLDPNQYLTGGTVIAPGPAKVIPGTQKLFVKSCTMDLQLTNGGNTSFMMEFCVLKCKKNIQNQNCFDYVWGNSLIAKRLDQIDAISPAVPSAINVAAGYPETTDYGQSPYAEKMFRDNFDVIWRKQYSLSPGENVKQMLHFKLNRLVRKDIAEELKASGSYYIRGDVVICAIVRPAPMAIVDESTNAIKAVTTAQAVLLYTSTQTYKISSFGCIAADFDRIYPNLVRTVEEGQEAVIVNAEDDIDMVETIGRNAA